jgi:hypothetical protein
LGFGGGFARLPGGLGDGRFSPLIQVRRPRGSQHPTANDHFVDQFIAQGSRFECGHGESPM